MPLDLSNSQSARTHRLKCKAIAGKPATAQVSNEKTVAESTFINFKLGRMPYLIQPASGAPATTDNGCCCEIPSCTRCSYFDASTMTLQEYRAMYVNTVPDFKESDIPQGFQNSVIMIIMISCNQNVSISSLSSKDLITGVITPININTRYDYKNIDARRYAKPEDVPTEFSYCGLDFIVIFPPNNPPIADNISTENFILSGGISPCNLPMQNLQDIDDSFFFM